MPVTIRDATLGDAPAIAGLLNATLATTTYEYTERPHTAAGRTEWLGRQQARGFPVLVAELNDEVVGYAAYGDFRDSSAREGYRFVVEHSVHVAEAQWGAGLGRALMEALIGRARDAGIHVMVGAIDSSNIDSLRFHERLGFVETGRMPEVGHKFGRWLDLVFVQKTL